MVMRRIKVDLLHTEIHLLLGKMSLYLEFRSFGSLVMSDSFTTPWTTALQAPLSMEFPRQEYWSGLPFPSAGDLPGPGIELTSLALAGRFFITEPPRKPLN